MSSLLNLRLSIQSSTIDIFMTSLSYTHEPSGEVIKLDRNDLEEDISKAKLYQDGCTEVTRPIINEVQEHPKVEFCNLDCLNYALELMEKGLNPVILNMANAEHPGGGKNIKKRKKQTNKQTND